MMQIFADRGIQSGWSADSIQSTLEGIEEKFEKCNDKLASVSVGPCSYESQADKIEKMTQDLQILQRYAGSAPDYVWDTLDNPLYVDFKNNATESLSQIILDDFYTDNTIGMEEHFAVSQKGAVYSRKRVKETLTFSDFFGLPAVEHEDSMVTLENVETVNEFASLFRKDYDKMKEADIETCIRNYLTSGEFNHEAYHPARDFLSGLLDITIVKPVIEFFTGTDLITGERLTEAQKYQKMAGAIVDVFTFGQGLVAMKGAGLVGKELCKAFGKTMLVEVASSASAYTVGYGVEAMGLPPQIAWMLGAATGCIVSTAGMNLVFRNPQTGVVRECSLEEITSLEKLDASEIDIAKLGKEVPTDDLELYMRYQKEGSIEHFTDGEKKTISRIETMGITGNECEEILRARGREVNRPPREEPEAVLPPRNESEGKGVASSKIGYEYLDEQLGNLKDKVKINQYQSAESVNAWWEARGYKSPYKEKTVVQNITLTEDTKFVRVYDGVNSNLEGGWVMRAEDIKGLTPKEIQARFALEYEPKFIGEVELKAGDTVRLGEVGPNFGFDGDGIQIDLQQQWIGDFTELGKIEDWR